MVVERKSGADSHLSDFRGNSYLSISLRFSYVVIRVLHLQVYKKGQRSKRENREGERNIYIGENNVSFTTLFALFVL